MVQISACFVVGGGETVYVCCRGRGSRINISVGAAFQSSLGDKGCLYAISVSPEDKTFPGKRIREQSFFDVNVQCAVI